MKILFGSVSFYSPNISGVGISTYLLAAFLQAKGHKTYVITASKERKNSVEKDITGTVTVLRLKSIKNPFRKGFFVPFSPKKRVKEIIEEIKPDVIHIQDPTPMNMALQGEAKKRGIPVVVTNHFMIDYVLAYSPYILRPIVKKVFIGKLVKFYNECDIITCPTQTIVDMLKKMGVTKPTHALSNGVDLSRFKKLLSKEGIRKKFNLPVKKTLVLCLGRLDKDKSIPILIEAIPKVLAKNKNVHFILAGWGDLYDKLIEDIKNKDLKKDITITGRVAYESDKLVALYQAADIFVIPSTIETQSIVTMEAMATGKPVVGANAGALPELIKDGENGFLFKPHDSADLAKKLLKIIQDPKLARSMGTKSLKIVQEHSSPLSLGKFEKLYKKCLK